MKEDIQIIERNGKPEWAVLPYEEYLKLIEQTELFEDIRDFDEMSAAIERGEEELIPAEVVHAILDGKNPIKVWREYRSLTQQKERRCVRRHSMPLEACNLTSVTPRRCIL